MRRPKLQQPVRDSDLARRLREEPVQSMDIDGSLDQILDCHTGAVTTQRDDRLSLDPIRDQSFLRIAAPPSSPSTIQAVLGACKSKPMIEPRPDLRRTRRDLITRDPQSRRLACLVRSDQACQLPVDQQLCGALSPKRRKDGATALDLSCTLLPNAAKHRAPRPIPVPPPAGHRAGAPKVLPSHAEAHSAPSTSG